MGINPHLLKVPAAVAMIAAVLSLPSLAIAEDIRANPQGLNPIAEPVSDRYSSQRYQAQSQGQDSSGDQFIFSHNPLAEDFNFYNQAGAPQRTIDGYRYNRGETSTDTQGADGGFPEWMPGSTFPWFIRSYSAPSTARPPQDNWKEPKCDYLGLRDPWVVPGTAIRHLGCEIRNMNTGVRERHHFDHCELDNMAHNAMPAESKAFMPAATDVRGWSSRNNRSLCPVPKWDEAPWGGGSWSGSSSGCGGTYTQQKTETRTVTCITNGSSPDSYCTQNGKPKPETSRVLTRTRNEPACPEPEPEPEPEPVPEPVPEPEIGQPVSTATYYDVDVVAIARVREDFATAASMMANMNIVTNCRVNCEIAPALNSRLVRAWGGGKDYNSRSNEPLYILINGVRFVTDPAIRLLGVSGGFQSNGNVTHGNYLYETISIRIPRGYL